jgi:hypothetical protein
MSVRGCYIALLMFALAGCFGGPHRVEKTAVPQDTTTADVANAATGNPADRQTIALDEAEVRKLQKQFADEAKRRINADNAEAEAARLAAEIASDKPATASVEGR